MICDFKGIKLTTKENVQEKCLFKYSEDNIVREGDFLIFYDGPTNINQAVMKKGGIYHGKSGKYKHDNIIDKVSYGEKIFLKMGYTIVLKPNSHLYSQSLRQRTQILYTPDISMII